MQTNNFTITGHITDSQTNQGVSDLRIEAWDKDLFFDDLVGRAETGAEAPPLKLSLQKYSGD